MVDDKQLAVLHQRVHLGLETLHTNTKGYCMRGNMKKGKLLALAVAERNPLIPSFIHAMRRFTNAACNTCKHHTS